MRHKNNVTLGQALEMMVKELKLKSKLDETRIQDGWERIMGKPIAKYTSSIALRGTKLYIKVENAPLKQELTYGCEKIRDLFNQELGSAVIQEVVIF
ncbi:MAG: DUF721 domain-containing protein [Chitinophagales bacterium]